MTRPNLLYRTIDTLWRWLLGCRRAILAVATLWAAALSASLLGGEPRWLAALTALLTESVAPHFGRLLWTVTILLFGAAILTQLADWIPGWRPPPMDWATWCQGVYPSATRAVSRLETMTTLARLSVTPPDKGRSRIGQARLAVLATPPTWLAALQTAISAGLVLTLAAASIIAMRGWVSDPIELVVGQYQTVRARDGQCAVTLQEVRIEPQPNSPARIDAGLSVEVTDGSAHAVRLAQGGRTMVQGVRVTWMDDGPAYRLSAHNAEGHPIALRRLYADQQGATLRIAFGDAQQEKWVALVDSSLLLRLALIDDPNKPYLNAQLVAGSSGDVLAGADIQQAETILFDGVTLDIVPEAYIRVALADASHRGSAWLALLLLAVGVVALAAEWVVGHDTVWLELEPQATSNTGALLDPNVTTGQQNAQVRWRAGGLASDVAPGWLADIAALLRKEEPVR